jgi:hypothetical protein
MVLLSMPASATRVVGPEAGNFPKLRLKRVHRGQDAIGALGTQLPRVAGAYGLQAHELRLKLSADPSIALDQEGRLVFTCEAPAAATTAPKLSNRILAAPIADTSASTAVLAPRRSSTSTSMATPPAARFGTPTSPAEPTS